MNRNDKTVGAKTIYSFVVPSCQNFFSLPIVMKVADWRSCALRFASHVK